MLLPLQPRPQSQHTRPHHHHLSTRRKLTLPLLLSQLQNQPTQHLSLHPSQHTNLHPSLTKHPRSHRLTLHLRSLNIHPSSMAHLSLKGQRTQLPSQHTSHLNQRPQLIKHPSPRPQHISHQSLKLLLTSHPNQRHQHTCHPHKRSSPTVPPSPRKSP